VLQKGTRIKVRRKGYRTVTGRVTRVFEYPSELEMPSMVEYRSFWNGGLYVAKWSEVHVEDRQQQKSPSKNENEENEDECR
jgi:hypothetical protein